MIDGLIGRKVGMTQVFEEDGTVGAGHGSQRPGPA